MWSGERQCVLVFFQAEDGIRDLVRSRGLGDVYKRQADDNNSSPPSAAASSLANSGVWGNAGASASASLGLSLIHI